MWDTLKRYGKELAAEFERDNVSSLAAALAYYATFSLVPAILLLVAVGGLLGAEGDVQERLLDQLNFWLGDVVTEIAREALDGAKPASARMASIVGIVAVLSGATQLFTELQGSLNRVWEVRPKGRGIVINLKRRVLSIFLILSLGILLVASFVASAAISYLNAVLGGYMIWELGITAVTLALGTGMFGAMFKYFPAVKLTNRDVALGALLTTIALMLSKYAFAFYVGRASLTSTYGAAGTFIAFLLWVYISANIVLLGAEFTQVHARLQGREIEVNDAAEWRA